MKDSFDDDHLSDHIPLLKPTSPQPSLPDTIPVTPGSFSTILRNFQFLNLVSVSVNVSTNHDEEQVPDKKEFPTGHQEGRVKTRIKDLRVQNSTSQSQCQGSHPGSSGSFSTLLRSFQIFNLVSVLVNVSTDREGERKPETPRSNGRKTLDYYQTIFGKESEEGSEKTVVHGSGPEEPTKQGAESKTPILFRLEGSDRIEAFTASTSYKFSDIVSIISDLSTSSPNCRLGIVTNVMDAPKTVEIDVDWNIENGRGWPKRMRLTERNCKAVLMLMERGMMGVLEVRMEGRGEVESSKN